LIGDNAYRENITESTPAGKERKGQWKAHQEHALSVAGNLRPSEGSGKGGLLLTRNKRSGWPNPISPLGKEKGV